MLMCYRWLCSLGGIKVENDDDDFSYEEDIRDEYDFNETSSPSILIPKKEKGRIYLTNRLDILELLQPLWDKVRFIRHVYIRS
jgi:hypothetical protein